MVEELIKSDCLGIVVHRVEKGYRLEEPIYIFELINQKWERLTGLEKGIFKDRSFKDFNEKTELHFMSWQLALDDFSMKNKKTPKLTLNHQTFEVDFLRLDESHLMTIFIKNITELDDNYEGFFQSELNINWILDLEGKVLKVNNMLEKLTGYSSDEIVGQSAIILHAPEKREEAKQIMTDMIAGIRHSCELPLWTKNGFEIWVETKVQLGMWKGQKVIFGTSKDLTAIKLSEEKFARLTNNNPNIIGLSKLENGEYVEVNQAFYDTLEFSPEEVIGKRAEDVLRLDKESIAVIKKKFLQDGFIRNEEVIAYSKSGKPIPLLLFAEIITIHNQKYNYTIGVNIEKQKHAETLLKVSQQQYKKLVENINDVLFTLDQNGIIKFMSPVVTSLSGIPAEDYIGKHFNSFIYQEDLELVVGYFSDLKQGKEYPSEYRIRTLNGDEIWIRSSTKPFINSANEIEYNGIAIDITREKRMRRLAKEKDRKLEAITQSAQDGILMMNDQGIIDFANAAVGQIMGYPIDELLGKDLHQLLAPQRYHQRFAEAFKHFVKTGEGNAVNKTVELQALRKDRKEIAVELSMTAFQSGKHWNAVGILRDISEKKDMLEAIQESEEKYRIVADNTYNWEFWEGPDGDFIYHSPSCIKITGYSCEQLLKDKNLFYNIIHPDDLQRYKSHHTDYQESPDFGIHHFRIIDAYGQEKTIEHSCQPVFDKENNFLGIRGSNVDITERIKTAEALKESEERFRQIANLSQTVIWEVDIKGVYTYVSPVCEIVYGFKPEELIGKKHYFDLHPDNERQKFVDETMALIEKDGHIRNFLNPVQQPNGEIRWVITNGLPIKDSAEKTIGYRGSDDDVTYRVAFEKELVNAKEIAEKNELKVRSMFENTLTGILFCNTEGQILEANQAVLDMMGSPNLEQSLKINLLTHPNLVKAGFSESMRKCLDERQIITGDLVYTSHWSKTAYIKYHLIPVVYNEKLLGVWANLQDLTDLWKSQEALRAAKEKAEESDRLKTAFLMNMSHEIRTPMNGIIGFLNLMNEPELGKTELQMFIDLVNKSGQRLLNTINDIIEVSKIESGQLELNESQFNVEDIMSFHLDFFKPIAKEKNLELICSQEVKGENAQIVSDKFKIEGVLTNLLNNAIKFTSKGRIEFGNYLENNHINFYVKDTGIGIPLKKQSRVFERFVQAEINSTRPYEGSGLGLTISKAYVEKMGGTIKMESRQGEGTVFTFSIPLNKATQSQPEINEQTPAKEFSKKLQKIIIAEDDDINIMVLQKMLKKMPLDIIFCKNGVDTLDALKENQEVKLILMDIKMPLMNGLEATLEIRKTDKHLPIIAQTAHAFSGEREKAMEAGCNHYLTKPLNRQELIDTINKYL